MTAKPFLVIVDDHVTNRYASAAEAGAHLDGYGRGEVAEVLTKAQGNRRRRAVSRKSKTAKIA
jgi:hypothetical protein